MLLCNLWNNIEEDQIKDACLFVYVLFYLLHSLASLSSVLEPMGNSLFCRMLLWRALCVVSCHLGLLAIWVRGNKEEQVSGQLIS